MAPIVQAFEVNSTNAYLADSLVDVEACGMKWKTPVGVEFL